MTTSFRPLFLPSDILSIQLLHALHFFLTFRPSGDKHLKHEYVGKDSEGERERRGEREGGGERQKQLSQGFEGRREEMGGEGEQNMPPFSPCLPPSTFARLKQQRETSGVRRGGGRESFEVFGRPQWGWRWGWGGGEERANLTLGEQEKESSERQVRRERKEKEVQSY